MNVDEAKRLFTYDPDQGLLYWRAQLNQRIKIGSIAGTKTPKGYLFVGIKDRKYAVHRIAWLLSTGRWPRNQIDHINRIRNDNRLANLREATNSDNQLNRWPKASPPGTPSTRGSNGRFIKMLKATTLSDEAKKARHGKFTGTAANTIMNGDPYKITDLWKMFTGDPSYVEPDFSEVWPVQLGIATEQLNLDWAELKYGPVTRRGEVVCGLGSLDWTAATLDGWLMSTTCPIEAKCVNGRSVLDDVIARYQPQMHWQMMVTKTTQCALSVIIGSNEPIVEFIPLNKQYARELWARATAFWLCVRSKTPPVELPAVPPPPMPVREYDMADNGVWKDHAYRWVQAYGAVQTAKDAEKILKSLVPPDAKLCYGHGVVIVRNRAGAMSLRESK